MRIAVVIVFILSLTVFIRRGFPGDIRKNLSADFGRKSLIDKLFSDGACVYPAEGAGRFSGDVT